MSIRVVEGHPFQLDFLVLELAVSSITTGVGARAGFPIFPPPYPASEMMPHSEGLVLT